MIHLEVAVAAPVAETLTYSYPATDKKDLTPGCRLLVPLGRRKVTGYLLAIEKKTKKDYPVKPISDILDQEPLFPPSLIPFFRWIARYYRFPLGEVIRQSLPAGVNPQYGREIEIIAHREDELAAKVTDNRPKWFSHLLTEKKLSPAQVRQIWGGKWRRQLEKWQADGLITIKEIISRPRTRQKTEVCLAITCDLQPEVFSKLKPSEKKTMELLTDLISRSPKTTIPRRTLTRIYPGGGRALKGLEAINLVTLSTEQVYRDPFGEQPPHYPPPAVLSDEQKEALTRIKPAIKSCQFKPILLHGVTGSGKTEIYLQAAQESLANEKTVLVLVPEIALATQMEGHFLSRFGEKQVAILHSGLSAGERYDQWLRISRGQARIIIGARSAIFAPISQPGLIIVDEEHDPAYKQEDGLRYQARDLAVLRAQMAECVVILGSATPALTTYHHGTSGKYQVLTLHKRIEDRPQPEVKIIDLKEIKQKGSPPPLFSAQLKDAINATLDAGNQIIIFLNRRGYASLMLCLDCGNPVQCPHCQVTLTLHKGRNILTCHYCNHSIHSAAICPNCQSTKIKEIGFGTERVKEELAGLYPEARIARLDQDTGNNRRHFLTTLQKVRKGEIDILVGTQMIAKGHHFPNVTLVGVVWADAGLGLPDYKAGERTFQLLAQVTGRAGRGEKPGQVIIQTNQPDHYSLIHSCQHDYPGFFQRECQLRRVLDFPPYSRLINIGLAGEDPAKVEKAAITAANLLSQTCRQQIAVLGPAPAPLARLRGQYRWQILLKGKNPPLLQASLDRFLNSLPRELQSSAIKLTVDVDPENML